MAIEEIRRGGVRRIRPMYKARDAIPVGLSFMQDLRIHIYPRCVNTIEEFNTYVYAQDKEGNWLNQPVDKNNHVIDAVRYSLMDYYAGGAPKAVSLKRIF